MLYSLTVQSEYRARADVVADVAVAVVVDVVNVVDVVDVSACDADGAGQSY